MASGANKPVCTGCKRAQERRGKPPRLLTRLPAEVTQYHKFKRKAKPLFLCEFCDGPALPRAITEHKARTKKPDPSA